MIVQPVGIGLQDWADQLVVDFGAPRLDGLDWREWASRVLEAPAFGSVPRPDSYGTWVEWADAVVQAIG